VSISREPLYEISSSPSFVTFYYDLTFTPQLGWIGFLVSGKTKIRFEDAQWNQRCSLLVNVPASNAKEGEEGEWKRFVLAARVDLKAAIESTSFGRWQMMGFNHKEAGYPVGYDYYIDMLVSEHRHLDAFTVFVKNKSSLRNAMEKTLTEVPLKLTTCEDMAAGYNGRKWRKYNPYYASDLLAYFNAYKSNLYAKVKRREH
jgi:hypothetical protein